MMSGKPEYRIYALKYAGPRKRPGSLLTWCQDFDTSVAFNFYIWFVQGGGEAIVVDTGAAPSLARQRTMEHYVNPASMLERIGVRAATVRHVVLTHLHWDHAGGVGLFPNATFYVQEDEYHFWLESSHAQRPPFRSAYVWDDSYRGTLTELKRKGQIAFLHGDQALLPGVDCLLTPGHTPGMQAVAVSTAQGTAVLGSDCAMMFRNYQEDWPGTIMVDMIAWLQSYDKLRAIVSTPELLFPGHDPLLTARYPAITRDVTRLA